MNIIRPLDVHAILNPYTRHHEQLESITIAYYKRETGQKPKGVDFFKVYIAEII